MPVYFAICGVWRFFVSVNWLAFLLNYIFSSVLSFKEEKGNALRGLDCYCDQPNFWMSALKNGSSIAKTMAVLLSNIV